jgi:hypothetical protein
MFKAILISLMFFGSLAHSAYVKPRTINWTASTSTDVASHLIYVAKQGETITYTTQNVVVPMPTTSYSLPGTFATYFTTNGSGNYIIGAAAQDSVGNISDIALSGVIAIDFLPPNAPSAIVVN